MNHNTISYLRIGINPYEGNNAHTDRRFFPHKNLLTPSLGRPTQTGYVTPHVQQSASKSLEVDAVTGRSMGLAQLQCSCSEMIS